MHGKPGASASECGLASPMQVVGEKVGEKDSLLSLSCSAAF